MTKEEIAGIIKTFLIEEFEIEEEKIVASAHLKDDLGLESLDFVDIAVIVQKEFGLTLKGEEMTAIRTLDDLHEYIFTCIHKK
jgi:acyl carrier protein